jgi:putative transcriptional regulator
MNLCYTSICVEVSIVISYKKLWKLLIDRDLKKRDLQMMAGISSASIAKLGKGENVNTDILVKICNALNCDVSDIMEIATDEATIRQHNNN